MVLGVDSFRRIIAVAVLLCVILPLEAAARCVGDCNRNGTVDIAELVTGVNVVLGSLCGATAAPSTTMAISRSPSLR